VSKVFKFLVAGLPAFAVAIPVNYVLVTYGNVYEWQAYALVLFIQVSINFFMCRWFVFDIEQTQSIWKQYFTFLAGIMGFRLGDWALYSLMVEYFHIYFISAQAFNVFLFSLLKFSFAKNLMEPIKKSNV